METPSSMRKTTRSQDAEVFINTANSTNTNTIPISRKGEDSSKSRQRKENQDRSALIDITNDSPIVGLATDSSDSPLSSVGKQRRNQPKMTPGSGEALLRGTVKTLLQKVEEEGEMSKNSMESRPFIRLKQFLNTPRGLQAPTPTNTPQVLGLSASESFKDDNLVTETPIEDQLMIPQGQEFDQEEEEDYEKSMIRSLLLDFSSKTENSEFSDCSSVVTHQDTVISKEKSGIEDDDASIWSIQVNASSRDDEDEDEVIEEGEEEDDKEEYYDEYYEGEGDDELLDELCEGINKMQVKSAEFKGKHTRFVYNSDDEIVEEEVCDNSETGEPGSVVRLKGLPTPEGKHLRFLDDEDE